RIGPNRVGPKGLFQSVADGLKFLFKEEIIPRHVDRFLYLLAPAIALGVPLLAFVVVPFGATEAPPGPPKPPVAVGEKGPPVERDAYKDARKKYDKALQAFRQEQAAYRERYQFVIAPGLDIGIVFVFALSSLAVYGIILGGWAGNNKYSFLGALR